MGLCIVICNVDHYLNTKTKFVENCDDDERPKNRNMSNDNPEEIISTYKKLTSECQQIASKISEVFVKYKGLHRSYDLISVNN